jgi:hypothetical protein
MAMVYFGLILHVSVREFAEIRWEHDYMKTGRL